MSPARQLPTLREHHPPTTHPSLYEPFPLERRVRRRTSMSSLPSPAALAEPSPLPEVTPCSSCVSSSELSPSSSRSSKKLSAKVAITFAAGVPD